MKKKEIAEKIVKSIDSSLYLGLREVPNRGQFLITGAQVGEMDFERYIGYCVQVRLGVGAFGTNQYFLRHPDGVLRTHENQSFFAMTDAQEALARAIFEVLPEDEDYEGGYALHEGREERIGYIIDDPTLERSQATCAFAITITSGGD